MHITSLIMAIKIIAIYFLFSLTITSKVQANDTTESKTNWGEVAIAYTDIGLYTKEQGIFESRQTAYEKYVFKIKSYAAGNNIDNFIYEAVYVNPNYSISHEEIVNSLPTKKNLKSPSIFFVNSNRILDELNNDNLKKINEITRDFIKFIGADLVLQEAVYINERIDLTADLVDFYKTKKIPDILKFKHKAKIAFLDSRILFKAKSFNKIRDSYGESTAKEIFTKRTNTLITKFSQNNEIDIVLQSDYNKISRNEISFELLDYIEKNISTD